MYKHASISYIFIQGLQMLANMVELLSLITLLMFVTSDICTKYFDLLR